MTDRKRGKNNKDFLRALDQVIDRHAMLKHPFYKAWNEGELSKEMLAEYAKQYYAHVRMFPRYVSAVHSRCEDQTSRRLLLENLIEEEQGENNHPELWLRFAEALGLQRDAAKTASLLPSTRESVSTINSLTQGKDFVGGVAALYAYESQIPEVARTKREGLKKFYGIADARSVSFFTVHEKADLLHRRAERDILARHCVSRQSQNRALKAAEKSANALWHFLDGVHEAYLK
jgi:pyrroloquinoline-quinone synthase